MGIEIDHDRFRAEDFLRFRERLQHGLTALDTVLARPNFGRGERSLGVEVELFLIDDKSRPLPVSRQIVQDAANPLITPEMGEFDLEFSTPPVVLAGRPLTALGEHMRGAVAELTRRARDYGARVVPISILPTFQRGDFHPGTITDLPRYRALAAGLLRLRQAPLHIAIAGEEPLDLTTNDVAMEAANTAFQVHLRCSAEEFSRLFNVALMLTGPVLAASGNSPTFLGHRLWQETRVALFAQAGEDRPPAADWSLPSRINFGTGWVREGAAELFRESVALYQPILPICADEDALAVATSGSVPRLDELRLHHGTVWSWNRPVYDPTGDGHLRIELRALPAGPSVEDMLANAAFFVGGILALGPDVAELLPGFPFALAERNFYRAAQYGLHAELAWPMSSGAAPASLRAADLLLALIPRARAGLLAAGVAKDEVQHYLGVFEARVRSGITGAVWQCKTLEAMEERGISREHALRTMLERYIVGVESGLPVHSWLVAA